MFELPDLPYSHDALAPHMSAETLEFHHDKHHKAYVDKANDLIDHTDLKGKSLEEIVQATHGQNAALFNNAAQHYNHLHFWRWMKPNGGGSIPSELEDRIKLDFGSVEEFKQAFVKAGTGQFGSGWCWLEFFDGKLRVAATPNAENPLVYGGVPILGCDVWEHSYYLDHRNDRGAYVERFLESLVDWEYASELLGGCTGS